MVKCLTIGRFVSPDAVHHMMLQASDSSESLVTNRTSMRLLSRVFSFMSCQSSAMLK